MSQIVLRFYEELNDFLLPDRRKAEFIHPLTGKVSIKDVIEALGVPHTEVDLILVNQRSVDFAYLVQPDDRISVYPQFESFDISPLIRLRPKPLRETRFVLDVHLGKLAVYLRFWGFDTLYRNDYTDATLAQISVTEKRILLTRDRNLLKRRMITHGYWVRAIQPKEQLAEIVRRLQLAPPEPRRCRCTLCNTPLTPPTPAEVERGLPPDRQKYQPPFYYCRQCQKIYWQGSHYHNMQKCLREILT